MSSFSLNVHKDLRRTIACLSADKENLRSCLPTSKKDDIFFPNWSFHSSYLATDFHRFTL
ncbi:MAG: hypothetical protein IID16_03330 [Candidatus Marinimicrobia bacterium]|nr:hypothetical protein [Candidatus Neomarinimicrobiota bacterium]